MKPRHALVVDDVPEMRSLLKQTLHQLGIQDISDASNGKQALESYFENGQDVVFLDIDLPDMSGLDILEQLLERNSRVYVVMVSGEASIDNVKTALGKGAKGFVAKPYNPGKLKGALDRFGA